MLKSSSHPKAFHYCCWRCCTMAMTWQESHTAYIEKLFRLNGQNKGLIVVITCLLFIKGESHNLCIVSQCTEQQPLTFWSPRKFVKRYGWKFNRAYWPPTKTAANSNLLLSMLSLLLCSFLTASLNEQPNQNEQIYLCTGWIGAPIFIIISYAGAILFRSIRSISLLLFHFDVVLFTQIIIDSSPNLSRQLCTNSHIIYLGICFFNARPPAYIRYPPRNGVLCWVKMRTGGKQDDEKWQNNWATVRKRLCYD